jgi:hypothetical protein
MFRGQGYPRRRKLKLLFAPVFVALFFVVSYVVQLLWNAILPGALHASPLTYWQAAGILVLCKILFGSFHFNKRGHHAPPFDGQLPDMREKWRNMSDEERAKFKEEFKERCRMHRR